MTDASVTSFEPLIGQREVARLSGLSESTLEKFRLTGNGPAFMKIGRAVRYRPADVRAWLAGFRTARTTRKAATA
jgi:predicted DNA-binding transcriptional regulator AlpA